MVEVAEPGYTCSVDCHVAWVAAAFSDIEIDGVKILGPDEMAPLPAEQQPWYRQTTGWRADDDH